MNKLNVLISHSVPLKTSVVQVLAEGQMTLVAHLVGKETIGDQIHLGLQFVSLFFIFWTSLGIFPKILANLATPAHSRDILVEFSF
jgi:hypothetical protein